MVSACALRVIVVAVAVTETSLAERLLDAGFYLDKLHGMWLGQLIGNLTGRPTEGDFGGASPNPAASVPWVLLDVWPADDDTDIEYLYQHVLMSQDGDFGWAVLRDEWLAHVPLAGIYIANRQARHHMDAGALPPLSGDRHLNAWWNAIDAQIATESVGACAPGLRQAAVDVVGRLARVTNDGHAVHAAQFYAAMYAAAVFEPNVPVLIERALECLPHTSRSRAVIEDVRAWHAADLADGQPDWRATRQLLYAHYQGSDSHGRYVHWVESTINLGATVLALLYGDGDYEQTVQIAVLAGWDCDCNPATAGGLLGLICGYSGLPTALTASCGDVYRNQYRPDLPNPGPPPQDDSIVAIAGRWRDVAERVIISNGGSIIGEGANRSYLVPDEQPLIVELDLPDPSGAGGVVGALRALGESVTVSASVLTTNASHDRYDSAAIADGVVDPRHNGHRAYWTKDADPNQPAGGDFYQLTFPRMVRVDRVVFHEGDHPLAANANPYTAAREGGFFVDLAVEVHRHGAWLAAPEIVQSEPLDVFRQYQSIQLSFRPQWCDAVRIRGAAGGTQQYTTIMELEADGLVTDPAKKADMDGDGIVTFFDIDPFVQALGDPEALVPLYPAVNPYDAADVNGDGTIDFFDIDPFVSLLGTL